MIHMLIVIPVKAGELLLAVRRIIGRVNIQDNHIRSCRERLHILFLKLTDERAQFPSVHGVL